MNHVFSTISDVRRYASDQLEGYDPAEGETHDDLIDRLAHIIRNTDGFAYGADMTDLLGSLYDEQHGGWTPLLYDDASPAYTITADYEYGDDGYHCATLRIGDYEWSYATVDQYGLTMTITYRMAHDAGILDTDVEDSIDDYNMDDVVAEIEDFADHVREEMYKADEEAESNYASAEIDAKADEAAEDIADYDSFLWWSPRGFDNECVLYGVKGDEVDEVEAWLDDKNPAKSRWEWMGADKAREELREGIDNRVNFERGFGADNPPCGVTKIIPWSSPMETMWDA